jgi:hypothetical protein
MKKNYFIAILALVVNFASAQIEPTTYRGAFAPAPTAMWTDSWANWDPQNEPYTDPTTTGSVVSVTTNITTNTTWTTGKTYKITGLIYVTNNATLTIQPGVIVKGVYTNTGTALIITKGAKINAVGTATQPIVFTSNKAAGQRAAGDWGGIILLGKAGFNLNGGVNNIEGITATVNTEYGGGASPIANDNSGTMKYCRIEFPGFVFSPNNEINGLTMGAVGSGTTIDYVQVSYSGDDSFEWFGGSVNCKHIVAYRGLDDDFDTDNGYKGIVQFALGIRDPSIADNPSISTSEGFESDNNAGGTVTSGTDNTSAIFTNCTLIGPKFRSTIAPTVSLASGHERALRLRRATELKVFNSIFLDFKSNILFIDGSAALANATAASPKLIFKNNTLAGALDGTYTSGFNLNGTNAATPLPTYLSSNTVQSSSASVLTKAYGSASTDWTAGNDYTANLDYRPVSSTGADFTDSSLTPYITAVVGTEPQVTNRTYCKGDVATPLTATLTTTGVSLKWYNAVVNATTGVVSVGTLISTGAPTPVTTAVGVKYYYVSQVDGFGFESAKVRVSVTVNDIPTEVLAAITGTDPDGLITSAAITAVGKFVGTTSSFTYTTSVTTPTTGTLAAGSTYLWTVPNGVNITSGQGTASITVNFANVPAGAGTIGTINVQVVNANGCKNVAKTLTITKALPTAPATLVLTNRALSGTAATTAITNYGPYMGQSTPLTLTAGAVATASGYQWELPAGVNLAIPAGTTPVTTTKTYTAEPFLSPNTPSTTVGTKFWTVTKRDYTFDVNGVSTTTSVSTAKQNIVGSGTYTFTITAGAIGVNQVGTVFTYNGDTYILTTATTASSTSVVCAVVFPLEGSNYPAYTTTISGSLTKVSDGSTVAFTKITVVQGRTYTFTITAGTIGANAVGTPFTYNGDTYYLSTATTSASTSVACYVANPQPAGNYPNSSTSGTLTNAITGATTDFSKIVKAGYQATTSQDYASYGTKIVSDKNAILVKFDGVTNSATIKVYLGVKSVNGVGASVTSNATNTDLSAVTPIPGLLYTSYTETFTPPVLSTLTNATSVFAASGTSPSTAKLLVLTAVIPAAPAAVTLTDPALAGTAATTAITIISKYIGTSRTLRLTATASPLASSYEWELPTWVNVVSGNPLTDRVIDVNFAGNATAAAPAGVTSYYFGARAKNGIGYSVTNNATLTPATTSTAKLLKVTTSLPAIVATVTGQIVSLCPGQSVTYTFTASPLANTYTITAPVGSTVTSTSNPSNVGNVLTSSSDLNFTVTFPSVFSIVTATLTADKSITIRSENGVGNSTTNKVLTLTTALGALGANTNSYVNPSTGATSLTLFGKCNPQTISVPAVPFATSYVWTLQNGATGTSTTNSIVVDFSQVATPTATTKNIVKVKAVNACNSSVEKLITLTWDGIQVCAKQAPTAVISGEVSQIYPNPAVDTFNLDLSTTLGSEVSLTIYAINGAIVKTSKVQLVEGFNTVSEDVSNLGEGIYFVKLYNATNNETIVRKLVKR